MRAYLDTTRTHTYSLLFALPLLVLYELGAMAIADRGGGGMRNGADVLLRTLLAAGGVQGTLAFTAALAVGAAVIVALERRKKRVPLRGAYFAGMLAESAVYALLFGFVVAMATQALLGGMVRFAADGGVSALPMLDGIVLSLGAGIYEELLFRVILTGGLFALLLAMGIRRNPAALVALVASAFIFSAFHYVGPYAYPLELNSFTFRFLAGLAFSALYMARGFGVAAWTHALYDVFLVLAGQG
jgi:membrane protease YdiL (CAAX protease family)